MAKNPNGKSMKRDNSLYGAIIFFLAACVAELFLLLVRKYYVHGKVEQILQWHDLYLKIVIGGGVALLALGIALSVLWKADERKRLIGWCLTGAGVFFACGTILIRMYYSTAVTLLSIIVPVVMVLSVLWAFYERECSVSLTIMSASLIVLWVCRHVFSHLKLGVPAKVGSIVYIALLVGFCWLAKNRKLGKLLPANADLMPLYIVCGLSAVGVVVALFSAVAAYYAMWGLGIVLFALAVYYTVKQL